MKKYVKARNQWVESENAALIKAARIAYDKLIDPPITFEELVSQLPSSSRSAEYGSPIVYVDIAKTSDELAIGIDFSRTMPMMRYYRIWTAGSGLGRAPSSRIEFGRLKRKGQIVGGEAEVDNELWTPSRERRRRQDELAAMLTPEDIMPALVSLVQAANDILLRKDTNFSVSDAQRVLVDNLPQLDESSISVLDISSWGSGSGGYEIRVEFEVYAYDGCLVQSHPLFRVEDLPYGIEVLPIETDFEVRDLILDYAYAAIPDFGYKAKQ